MYEASLSSTWREQLLWCCVLLLAGHRVKWFTNNKNIVRIVESGNKRQPIALDIFEVRFKYGVRLDMEWIPRGLNDKADYISDFDDWKVNPRFSHGLMNCGVPIHWTVLPVLRTLSCLHSIVDSGARILQRLMLLQ